MTKKKKLPLNEVAAAENYWVKPDGNIVEVYDHVDWFLNNVENDTFEIYDGMPITKTGAIAELRDVYDLAESMGYIRIVNDSEYPIYISYSLKRPPTNIQWRNIKNFAIENQKELHDATTNRPIEL